MKQGYVCTPTSATMFKRGTEVNAAFLVIADAVIQQVRKMENVFQNIIKSMINPSHIRLQVMENSCYLTLKVTFLQ